MEAPHPLNAPGPFYVVHELCMACCAPEAEAPTLMGHTNTPYYHCYFKRQPADKNELEQACRAVQVSCVQAVRYAGKDPMVVERLGEMGAASSCDNS